MRNPRAIVRQWLCPYIHTHEVEWTYAAMTGHRRCRHCHAAMPLIEDRPTVGTIHPDSGD